MCLIGRYRRQLIRMTACGKFCVAHHDSIKLSARVKLGARLEASSSHSHLNYHIHSLWLMCANKSWRRRQLLFLFFFIRVAKQSNGGRSFLRFRQPIVPISRPKGDVPVQSPCVKYKCRIERMKSGKPRTKTRPWTLKRVEKLADQPQLPGFDIVARDSQAVMEIKVSDNPHTIDMFTQHWDFDLGSWDEDDEKKSCLSFKFLFGMWKKKMCKTEMLTKNEIFISAERKKDVYVAHDEARRKIMLFLNRRKWSFLKHGVGFDSRRFSHDWKSICAIWRRNRVASPERLRFFFVYLRWLNL